MLMGDLQNIEEYKAWKQSFNEEKREKNELRKAAGKSRRAREQEGAAFMDGEVIAYAGGYMRVKLGTNPPRKIKMEEVAQRIRRIELEKEQPGPSKSSLEQAAGIIDSIISGGEKEAANRFLAMTAYTAE